MNSVTADIIALFIAAVVPPVGVYYVTRGILGMLGKIGAPIDSGLKKIGKAGQEKAMQGRIGEFAEDQKRRKEVRKFQRRAGNGALAQWGRDEKRSGTLRGRAATWLGTRQKAFDERYVLQFFFCMAEFKARRCFLRDVRSSRFCCIGHITTAQNR